MMYIFMHIFFMHYNMIKKFTLEFSCYKVMLEAMMVMLHLQHDITYSVYSNTPSFQ